MPSPKTDIQRELERIARGDPERVIHPESVVDFAKANEGSVLHKMFPWDDTIAAHAHRLNIARQIIRVNVVMLESPLKKDIVVTVAEYISLPDHRGQGYERVTDVLSDVDRREAMLRYTIERLQAIKEVNILPELAEVAAAIAMVAEKYISCPDAKKRRRGRGDDPMMSV